MTMTERLPPLRLRASQSSTSHGMETDTSQSLEAVTMQKPSHAEPRRARREGLPSSVAASATGHPTVTGPPAFQSSILRASASPRESIPVLISPPTPSPNKEPTPPAFFASSRLRVSHFCDGTKPHAKPRRPRRGKIATRTQPPSSVPLPSPRFPRASETSRPDTPTADEEPARQRLATRVGIGIGIGIGIENSKRRTGSDPDAPWQLRAFPKPCPQARRAVRR
jgi:hypothetical protein